MMDIKDDDMIKCQQCGKAFRAKRSDAKFCSESCKKAYARDQSKQANLTWEGQVVRGQHEDDAAATGAGMISARCRSCGKVFKRWIDSKLARLVRNEVEGSVNWGSAENFRKMSQRFEELMAIRKEEVKFCSDECQQRGPKPLEIPPAPQGNTGEVASEGEKTEENSPKVRENFTPAKHRGHK